MLKSLGLGWHGINLKEQSKKDRKETAIPCVCVCVQVCVLVACLGHSATQSVSCSLVDCSKPDQICDRICAQGGPGTIKTVLHSLQDSTPALLVRGTGKAADLLSDAVGIRSGRERSGEG